MVGTRKKSQEEKRLCILMPRENISRMTKSERKFLRQLKYLLSLVTINEKLSNSKRFAHQYWQQYFLGGFESPCPLTLTLLTK